MESSGSVAAAAASRLRRTFAYPSDGADPQRDRRDYDDDDDEDVALDEEEQEDLITRLSSQNANANASFRMFLLALPVLSAIPYLLALVNPAGAPGGRSLAIFALTSLASTAYLLHTLEPGTTGIALLDRYAGVGSGPSGAQDTLSPGHVATQNRRRRGSFSLPATAGHPLTGSSSSPLAFWLPYLNIGLCAVLVLMGLVAKTQGSSGEPRSWGHVGLGNLPAVVYAVVLLAKVVMGGVDPERELSKLKYEYKGA
ncbi:hypothetical protein BX600DRAFT_451398 [Xylariales sp. PMI_506]|nr:hypothetical protein BX600DRAFT_451398 [Xylariales sp. PMI_506]